jgi:hypothetical protein
MFGVSGLCMERLRQAGVSGLRLGLAYGVWSVLWVVAHMTGGALVGAALGAAGGRLPLAPQTSLGVLSAVLGLGGLHHLGLVRLPMPQIHRQVPRHWMLRWPPAWTAVGYGVQLGAAVATRITNFATYAALAAALLTRGAVPGALTLLVFGLTRALPAVVIGPLADSPQRSFALAFRVGEWEERVHKASGAILLLAALLLSLTIRSRV